MGSSGETGEDEGLKTTSPDAETVILFTKPPGTSNMELPAGQITEFLVGFTNKGDQEMIVDSMGASLRYPMDFTFHLQNFSAINYVKNVKAKQQATVAYSFVAADAFAGRPIGLTINLHYRDSAGNFFIDPVFNETVQIVEFDEGFDTETFFMYVCIAGGLVLLLFLGFNLLSGKKTSRPQKVVETGTEGEDGVDYEWIPKSALRSTPASGKTSPRQWESLCSRDRPPLTRTRATTWIICNKPDTAFLSPSSPFPLTRWQRLAPPSVHHKWQAGSPTVASQQAQV